MYHPGKIIKVLSSQDAEIKGHDSTTQAVLEMWDENVFTFLVDPNIAKEIKDGDIVLVDYTPLSSNNPVPKNTIIKILKGKTGGAVWKKYDDFNKKRKKSQAVQSPVGQTLSPSHYIG